MTLLLAAQYCAGPTLDGSTWTAPCPASQLPSLGFTTFGDTGTFSDPHVVVFFFSFAFLARVSAGVTQTSLFRAHTTATLKFQINYISLLRVCCDAVHVCIVGHFWEPQSFRSLSHLLPLFFVGLMSTLVRASYGNGLGASCTPGVNVPTSGTCFCNPTTTISNLCVGQAQCSLYINKNNVGCTPCNNGYSFVRYSLSISASCIFV